METDNSDIFKKGIIRIWIIWGAMFCSLFIYVVICHLLESTWVPVVTPNFPVDTLRDVLYGVSIVILFLSDYIRKFILKSESQLERFTQIASRTNMNPALFKYQTAVIISVALSESIGVFGLIFFLLNKDINTLYIFIATSAAAMLYHIPRMSQIK